MIFVITGKPGHGKTAYASKWAKQRLEKGETIYVNTKLNPHEMFSKKKYAKLFGEGEIEGDIIKPEDRKNKRILYWQNFSDWQYFNNGTIICDEGQIYFNARNWEALPRQMQMRLQQHRKEKLDLIVTVQDHTFIDKTIRILCESFLHCEMKIGSVQLKKTLLPRIARVSEIDIPTLNRCENLGIDPYNATREDIEKYHLENVYQEWFWIKPKIFTYYDTSAKMVESRPEDLIHSERKCIECGHVKLAHS